MMNSAGNSILTNLGVTPMNTNVNSGGFAGYVGLFLVLAIIGAISYIIYIFRVEVEQGWNDVKNTITKYFEHSPSPLLLLLFLLNIPPWLLSNREGYPMIQKQPRILRKLYPAV
jgi:hypothetical protein